MFLGPYWIWTAAAIRPSTGGERKPARSCGAHGHEWRAEVGGGENGTLGVTLPRNICPYGGQNFRKFWMQTWP